MSNQYKYIWSEQRSLINVESHIRQYLEQRQIFGSNHSYSFIYAKNGFAEELHREADNLKWVEMGKKLLNRRFVLRLIKEGAELRKEFAGFIKEIYNSDLRKASDSQLKKLFVKSYQYHSKFRAYFKISRQEFLTLAESRLRKLVKNKFGGHNDGQSIFEILTTPHQMDEVNLELLDWVKLVAEKEPKNIDNQVSRHLFKYPWLVAHSYDLSKILAHLKLRYRKDYKNQLTLQEKVKKFKLSKEKLRHKQEQLLIKVKSGQCTYLSWLFQTMSLERMRLKGAWSGSDFLYLPIYEEIKRRSKVELADLFSVYRIHEVIKAIDSKKDVVGVAEKNRRKKCYVLWLKNGKLQFYSGNDASSIIKKQLQKLVFQKELKGQPASGGHAKGRVRVIFPGDIEMLNLAFGDFKKGEILLTTMTQPNMLPIVAKSIAIVTDEGGLTSHAAIMARELKIPCIVGTQNCTKVFKDGDIVEVDAVRGVVRKI